MSQMAGVRELDQFFTRADVAAKCFGALSETLAKLAPANPQWFFVEPSAGDGAFSSFHLSRGETQPQIHTRPRVCQIFKWQGAGTQLQT